MEGGGEEDEKGGKKSVRGGGERIGRKKIGGAGNYGESHCLLPPLLLFPLSPSFHPPPLPPPFPPISQSQQIACEVSENAGHSIPAVELFAGGLTYCKCIT